MTTLYIARHGETLWNTEKRMQGHKDSDLSALGLQQAGWLKERLATIPIDAVYSSPCGRAVRTAQIICKGRNLEVQKDFGLIEIGLGLWEGTQIGEVSQLYPEQSQDFWNAPEQFSPTEGGETFTQVQQRISESVLHIVRMHPEQSVLLVSHAVVLKTLMAFMEQIALNEYWKRPFLTQASLSIAEAENSHFRMILNDDTSHHRFIRKRNVNTW